LDTEHTFQLNEALKPVGFNVTLICPTQATGAWNVAFHCDCQRLLPLP